MMQDDKITQIKKQLDQGTAALTQEQVEWLVKRVEELQKQNEWLKRELAYAEHQGEVSY